MINNKRAKILKINSIINFWTNNLLWTKISGFGDKFPGASVGNDKEAQEKLVITSVYLLFGMALLAMCFNLAQEEVFNCKLFNTITTPYKSIYNYKNLFIATNFFFFSIFDY